jgi:hypothetical protein
MRGGGLPMTNYFHMATEWAGPLFTPYLFQLLLLDLGVGAFVLVGYYLQSKMDRNRREAGSGVAPRAFAGRQIAAKAPRL